MAGRTNALVDLVAQELRRRRLTIDGAAHPRTIEMKVEFDKQGNVNGFRFAMHDTSRVSVQIERSGS